MNLGNSSRALPLWEWESACQKCSKNGTAGSILQPWTVCRKTWCPTCYVAALDLKFQQIALPENIEGLKWKKNTDEERFLQTKGR